MDTGAPVAMGDYDKHEKMRTKARKKHPQIVKHEQMADMMSDKADMARAHSDLHRAKARHMTTKVTNLMSKSEK